jgi:membrane protease YdiL (CAAX protease family)
MTGPEQTAGTDSLEREDAARDESGPDEPAETSRPDPAVAVLAVLGVGGVRLVEVLATETPETGVLVWSTAGAALVGGVLVWSTRDGVSPPAPSRARAVRALLVGGVAVAGVQAVAHALQVGAVALGDGAAVVAVEAVNPVTKTGTGVARYVLVGVGLTAVGEELLFRGAALGAFERRLPFHGANLAQAGLFGLWHLAWPLTLALGPGKPPVAPPVLALGTVLVTGLVGVVFGMLARATGTLWAPVLAHAVHNGVAVVVHVRAAGIDRAGVLSPTLVLGYAVLSWLVWRRFEEPLFENR